jgi:hypothetical protein
MASAKNYGNRSIGELVPYEKAHLDRHIRPKLVLALK